MLGFLLKIIIVAVIVVAVAGFFVKRKGSIPIISSPADLVYLIKHGLPDKIKTLDTHAVSQNLSSALDSVITHPDRNSPVVLGVKITNDSLNTLVNVIQNMPPEQADQIRQIICKPASKSAN